MEPVQRSYKFGGQPDAIGINFKAALIHLAVTGDNVKIPTRGGGEENGAVIILVLFKAASAALQAKPFPLAFTVFHGRRIQNQPGFVNAGDATSHQGVMTAYKSVIIMAVR